MAEKTTVLVTGGNRGVGLGIVTRFAQEGHAVFLASRDFDAGEAEAARLRGQGLDVETVALDVGDRASARDAVSRLEAAGRRIDVLINNAGVLPDGDLLGLGDEDIDISFAVNVIGPLTLVRLIAPGMASRGYGRIVNVSSDWGSFDAGLGGPGAYGVTKAALNALTLRLARDLPDSIKVNAMDPGWVKTRMGGDGATRTPEQAADTAYWLGTLPTEGPNGGFYYDRDPMAW